MDGSDQPVYVLTWNEVMLRARLSRGTIVSMVRRGEFPLPRRISRGSEGFLSTEFDAWLASRPAAKRPSAVQPCAAGC